MNKHYRDISADFAHPAVIRHTNTEFATGPLEVNVIFTSVDVTSAALKVAQSLARELGARIRLRTAVAVPFQLPLERPPVRVAFLREVLRKLVSHVERVPFEPTVHLYLCRQRVQALSQTLKPHSVIVVGARRHWWPTAESRITRALSSKGHQVIFVDCRERCGAHPSILQRSIFAR